VRQSTALIWAVWDFQDTILMNIVLQQLNRQDCSLMKYVNRHVQERKELISYLSTMLLSLRFNDFEMRGDSSFEK